MPPPASAVHHFLQAAALDLIVYCPPLPVFSWYVHSFLVMPLIAAGLCGKPGNRWYRMPVAIVSIPLSLVTGLMWLIYAYISMFIHPFAFLAFELLHCDSGVQPTRVAPGDEASERGCESCSVPASERNGLEALPEQGEGQRSRYLQHDSVWAALEGRQEEQGSVLPGDVRLLSANWLMDLAEKGGRLDRRQDLPEAAFLSAAQLKAIEARSRRRFHVGQILRLTSELMSGAGFLKSLLAIFAGLCCLRNERNVDRLLPIIAISYCWLEASHPDRDGRQLRLMCEKLKTLCGGRGLLGACRDYGFSDMGVFIDWASLYQKDPKLFKSKETPEAKPEAERAAFIEDLKAGHRSYGGEAYEQSRSDELKAAFHRALAQTMDLWYGHTCITVVLLTKLPADIEHTRSYEGRGWTTFERCSAELGKNFHLKVAKWKLVIDTGSEDGGVHRRLPTTPARMAVLLESRQFTNGADKAAVLELYRRTASSVLGSVRRLNFTSMDLTSGDGWCSPALLAEALNYCSAVEQVKLNGAQLSDKGIAELFDGLADGALPALKSLQLSGNRFAVQGVTTLCDNFSRGVAPQLEILGLTANLFGDDGAKAVAAAIYSGRMPKRLGYISLSWNDIGNEGAKEVAAALLKSGSGCLLHCNANRIGLSGQSALLQALEAKHGPSIALYASVFWNAPVLFPGFLMRVCSRGSRRNFEVKGKAL